MYNACFKSVSTPIYNINPMGIINEYVCVCDKSVNNITIYICAYDKELVINEIQLFILDSSSITKMSLLIIGRFNPCFVVILSATDIFNY